MLFEVFCFICKLSLKYLEFFRFKLNLFVCFDKMKRVIFFVDYFVCERIVF